MSDDKSYVSERNVKKVLGKIKISTLDVVFKDLGGSFKVSEGSNASEKIR